MIRRYAALAPVSVLLFACGSAQAPLAPPPAPSVAAPVAPVTASLDTLTAGADVGGFVAQALYVDDDDHPRGARFVHTRTHFVFDYLQIDSAPQAMLYVTTYPTSDAGEPHTQEHLLLGKGNKGRYLGNFEHVMLAQSNAFTAQYRTVYDFYTVAGTEAFWPLFRTELDTLLHPDYTDDEIRREVRDYGISKQADGALELAEKGTVYNEMVRTSESPGAAVWWSINRLIYGADHPLALVSGGTPEGIRKLSPADIRKFHAAHYQLGNMGMAGAFPSSLPLRNVLAKVGEELDGLASPAPEPKFVTEADLPPPHGATPGTLRVVDYPYATTEHPGPAMIAWPATRHLAIDERTTLDAFLAAFGRGEGSSLYKALIDQKTRALDVGATDVSAWVNTDLGQPPMIWLENVNPSHANEESLRAIRDLVKKELQAIAALPDGSKELAAFGERVKARVIQTRRDTDKFLDTPPEFGARNTGDDWLTHLDDVNRATTFRRSITKRDAYAHALAVASEAKNPWRDRIRAWGLLDDPYALVTRASPTLRASLDDERKARTQAELTRLERSYGVTDPKEALGRRDAEIARVTDALAHAEATVPMPPFWSDPPMTNDDGLAYRTDSVRGVPVVTSTFEGMKSVTVALALRLDVLPEDALPYLSVLPQLVSDVGVLHDGVPLSYEEVVERLRREVLRADVYLDVSYNKGRAELVLYASGNDVDEAKRALGWIRELLTTPDWRPENLPRIRDVVKQRATALHDVMSSSEEGWASELASAYRRRDHVALAHAGMFLTKAYDARRVGWMLEGGPDAKPVVRWLGELANVAAAKTKDRKALVKLTAALGDGDLTAARGVPKANLELVKRAGHDLGQLLGDVPDDTIASDWAAACKQMARDLEHPPADTLRAITRALATVRHASGARAAVVGSTRSQQTLNGDLDKLLASLDPAPAARATYVPGDRVIDRARARGAMTNGTSAAIVALVNPNTANGTLSNKGPGASLDSTGPALVDLLAASVFAGSGAQSLFKRIWASGLAYNGGIGVDPEGGRVAYYSDRCADLPQLVRNLSGHVKDEAADPRFVDYAVANSFYSRLGERYESRAIGMADDLADGTTPDRVRAFRQRLLELRKSPGLIDAMHARFVPVLGALLPPLGGATPLPADTVLFTIAPEAQIAAYEREVRADRGANVTLARLYPRDFWYTGEIAR